MKINFAQVMNYGKLVGGFLKRHKKGIFKVAKYTAGAGAIAYAVSKAPETVHAIEDAGCKKGEQLTKLETASIVVQKQYPAMIMMGVAVGADIVNDISTAKEVKEVVAENTTLLGQIADIGNSYNMVNDIKNAMSKKVEEIAGPEEVTKIEAPIQNTKTIEVLDKIPNSDRAYVSNRKRLEDWNDIYLRTGDVDYKIQEYILPCCGQTILSCNHAFDMADKAMNTLIDGETGRGFACQNDWLDMIGARLMDIDTGEMWIWRHQYERFGTRRMPIDVDGVAMIEVTFTCKPHCDVTGQYYY